MIEADTSTAKTYRPSSPFDLIQSILLKNPIPVIHLQCKPSPPLACPLSMLTRHCSRQHYLASATSLQKPHPTSPPFLTSPPLSSPDATSSSSAPSAQTIHQTPTSEIQPLCNHLYPPQQHPSKPRKKLRDIPTQKHGRCRGRGGIADGFYGGSVSREEAGDNEM